MRLKLRTGRACGLSAHATGGHFTLVEVVLGLAVIALGLISVAALFPVSLQATRDSIAGTYAADNADEFLHARALDLRNMPDWSVVTDQFTATKPGSTEPTETQWGDPWRPVGYAGDLDSTALLWRAGAKKEFCKIIQRTKGSEHVDFSAIGRLWISHVLQPDSQGVPTAIPFTSGVRLNFEISWPAVLPYERRTTSTFQLDVFKF